MNNVIFGHKFSGMRHTILFLFIIVIVFSSCNEQSNDNAANAIPLPTDTLKYTYQTVSSAAKDETVKNPKNLAQASISYPVLTGSPLADSLNARIQQYAYAGMGDAQKAADKFTQDATTARKEVTSPADLDAASMNRWYLNTGVNIIYQTIKMVTALVQSETFTGGAHPAHNTEIINLDYTGKKLDWNLIIDTGKTPDMMRLNETVLKAIRQIAPGRTWQQEGFLIEGDTLPLPKNFAFTKDGLMMFYNEYEIAPYAMGPVSYTISYSQLSGILKEGIRE